MSTSGRLVLAVQQNDIRLLQVLQEQLGGAIYGPTSRKSGMGGQERVYWTWKTQGWDLGVEILQKLEPHLILKRDKALLALRRAKARGFLVDS